MSFDFRNLFLMLLFILGLFLAGCKEEGEDGERPKEDKVKYFYMFGVYKPYMTSLDSHRNLRELYRDYDIEDLEEAYPHLTSEDLRSYIDISYFLEEDDVYIINLQGELVNIMDLVDSTDAVRIERTKSVDVYFKVKENFKNYREVGETYSLRGAYYRKYYCKKPYRLKVTTKNIEEDKVFVRLYDANHYMLSENEMKQAVFPDQEHIKSLVIGLLELPSVDKRENLKYRVVRLKPNGEPSLYLEPELKFFRDYIWEEKLAPYSEYKNWRYSEETGCYWYYSSPVL